jgi:type I restriction enzyme M protein
MTDLSRFNGVVNFLWDIANILRDSFRKSEFQNIVLPLTVLRRFDYALAPTREAVIARDRELRDRGLENRDAQLRIASGFAFYNTSRHTYDSLLRDPDNLAINLRQFVLGFSPNVREVFEKYNFDDTIRRLNEANLLYAVMEKFNERANANLSPDVLDNHAMGYVFEQLIRKFNEDLNETPGEHFTPREIIRLMVDLVVAQDEDLVTKGGTRTVYDPCCGTGGILTIAKEHLLAANPHAAIHLFGQELNPQTWAVARSDMLIANPDGRDADNIAQGTTLGADGHANRRFDYLLANPPYGKDWRMDKERIEAEAAHGHAGRFGAGLPPINDGQLLFLQHMLARMNAPEAGASHVAVLFNGSPLFTGDAGSGTSEIRRWIIENDWLDVIVGLPEQVFYNTGIRTYLWMLSNRKPAARQGKVTLVDASGRDFWEPMPRSLGDKRRQISEAQRRAIVDLVRAREDGPFVKTFDSRAFGYRKIQVERPMRQRFTVDAEAMARLEQSTTFRNLATSRKRDLREKAAEERTGRADQERYREVVRALAGPTWMDRAEFLPALARAARSKGTTLPTPIRNAIVKAVGVADPEAAPCRDARGNVEPDPDLRDTETVPLTETVQAYFDREVRPHAPDAWIDTDYRDPTDGQVGRVGYEIPFNRFFNTYVPPRPLDAIAADIRALETDIVRLLGEVTA